MKKIILILIAITSFSSAKLMDSESLFEIRRISDPRISPSGKYTSIQVSNIKIDSNSSTSKIYLINNTNKDTTLLANAGKHNSSAYWMPSKDELVFLSDRSGSMQAWKIAASGGEARQMTDIADGISNIKISPMGTYLAYTRDVEIKEDNEANYDNKYPKAKAYIYDELMIRHWDTWRDKKWRHIFLLNLNTGDTTDIMKGEPFDAPLSPFGGRSQFNFSPDEKEVAYTCKKGDNYENNTNSDIYIYNIASKKTNNITQGMMGYDMEPIYSPDGKYLAFHSMERPVYESDKNRIMLMNRNTKEIYEVTKKIDQPASKTTWLPNSDGLLFKAPSGFGTNTIYKIDLDGNYTDLTSRGFEGPRMIENYFDFGLRGFDISPDGSFMVASMENFTTQPELYYFDISAIGYEPIANLSGKIFQHSFFNTEYMKSFDNINIEKRIIKASDGKDIHTWIALPPNFDKNKKYPVLTYCQGGPQQQVSQYFSYGWSFMNFASQGYIVVAPNRRGCPGFGQDWTDAINQDYGGMPADDIMQATKAMLKEPYVDEDKQAAIGASAGGYMAFWLAGNDGGLYDAFVSHCGLFNLISMYGATEELFFPNFDNGGAWWQNREYYDDNSPHNFVKNWTKPILIITGEKDYRVSYTQSLEAFTAARELGVPARLIVYPNENHWVLKPQEKLIWYDEFFDFLDEYLK